VFPVSGVLGSGDRACSLPTKRWRLASPGPYQCPRSGSGTQETREIIGWYPQIRLPLCLHGYDNPLIQAHDPRSGATGPGPRFGCLRTIDGGMRRQQQRSLVGNLRWFIHRKGFDIGVPVLPRQARRHAAEWSKRGAAALGCRWRCTTVRWGSAIWRRRLRQQLEFPEGAEGVRQPPTEGCGRRKWSEQLGVCLLQQLHEAAWRHGAGVRCRSLGHHPDHNRHHQRGIPGSVVRL